MAEQRIYTIKINGLEESIKAVDSLNNSLKLLEEKINALQKITINIGAKMPDTSTSSGVKTSSTSALSEEEKLERQIAQLEEKRIAHSKQIYQNYLAAKDVLAETEKDQKQLAAAERVQANNYSNTMEGIKQKLADLKSVHFTTDISTDEFKNQTKEINELTSKLKKLEEEYGVFTRNVGNYASAADGFQKLSINVGGTVREFNNAREASRTLNNELNTMAVNGQTNTEQYKQLRNAIMEMESAIHDAKKPMDNLMDAMQSFTAIASVGEGLSALFGVDDSEIQRSIQKLVALQNILQGLQTIQTQMQTREGIGAWLAKGNDAIDSLVQKLTGAKKAQDELNVSTTAGKKSSEGLATAQKAQAIATSTATKATKLLSLALKSIGIGLVISLVAFLVSNWKELYKWLTDTVPVLKNLGSWFDKLKAVVMGVGSVIANYMLQPFATLAKTIQALINGKFSEIPKIISDGFKNTFNVASNFQKGFNKEIERQEEEHLKRRKEKLKKFYTDLQKDEEARYGESNKRTQEYLRKQMVLTEQGSEEHKDLQRQLWETERKEREKNQKKTANSAKKSQEDITKVEINAMKDGLNKTLMQLDEEERQTINKIKQNGVRVAELVKRTQQAFNQRRINAIQEYIQKLAKTIDDSSKQINNTKFEINLKGLELQLADTREYIRELTEDYQPIIRTLTSTSDYTDALNRIKQENKDFKLDNLKFAVEFDAKKSIKDTEDGAKEYYDWLKEYISKQSKEVQELFSYKNVETGELELNIPLLEQSLQDSYKKELAFVESYGYQANASLEESFKLRLASLDAYNEQYTSEVIDGLNEVAELRKKALLEEGKQTKKAEGERYAAQIEELKKQKEDVEKALKAIEGKYGETTSTGEIVVEQSDKVSKLAEEEKEAVLEQYRDLEGKLQEIDANIENAKKQHKAKIVQIAKDYAQQVKQVEVETEKETSQTVEKEYSDRISSYRDFISKMNNEASKQPVTDKAGWGIVNVKQTQKNYKEITDAGTLALNSLRQDKERLVQLFNDGLLTPEAYNAALTQMNDLETDISGTLEQITYASKETVGEFIGSINTYVQTALTSFNTIMQSVWQLQDYQFDKEQEALDKENEILQEKLDKQQEIIEEHKNNVDSIEDELANSRGDRRQHLIDQLNAEMDAQRAAQKEEERIQKEKDANEKKQEALDKKRKEAEYKRNLMSILVSTAMATANGLATKPFVPVGIAMGALATSLGMVQYALAKKAKPYRVGGQLEGGLVRGKRHSQGGVPVGNTGIEVEGDEMIIRRESTMPNIDVLNFINKSQRKLNIDDFIDFYSSGKVKKNIMNMSPKAKYADGGYLSLPAINYDFSINDRLLDSFERYASKPSVVQVVDIINKTDDINKVKVLAGLK